MRGILANAQQLAEQLTDWRRDLHQHPELGFEEQRTSEFVKKKLGEMGISELKTIAQTGVVAVMHGEQDGPTIMLRADMDALPIQDEKEVSYASSIPGKAHLCGHDAHTTILLGAAALLKKNGIPRGRVKLIFQPAEEGLAGAKAMIADGVLEHPKVDAVIGLHVYPSLSVGTIGVCPGSCTAFSDRFDLVIHGRGGHAAHPHQAVDAVTVTAQVLTALQQIASRMTDPLSPVVVTVGKIAGGYTRNVIAPSVTLEGTVRTLDRETQAAVPVLLEQIVNGICQSFGASYKLNYWNGYPSVVNDPSLIPLLEETAKDVLGQTTLKLKPSMGGEDFSYYAEQVPGLFFRLGVRNEEKGFIHPLHHPLFDLDEDSLPVGSAMLAQLALKYLDHHSN
ncbi:M20 metallopeptidase family protein [Paenibacillus radicis (ex Xue et al. 2023)]|uniref:M20 family metallopeptidase n=1 Tax=Paenibacillus radicis (ex Xue et al. 2023) TaxID=2972489 RepID=A0ABT1YR67_9BACL|nr:M20 family metallopeptidase [Paenibacillus radicis (ex Xue et al. 2023)]MCR8635656.1 M20 family metallopeptidase [Paenibacillus radicis (ex Xue et al. 2023)]